MQQLDYKKELLLPNQPYTRTYNIKQVKRNKLGALINSNEIETKIKVKLVKTLDDILIYRLDTIERNHTSNHPLHNLEADLLTVQSSLSIEVNKVGEIVKINNIRNMQEKWKRLKYELPKKYKKVYGIQEILRANTELVYNTPLFSQSVIDSELIELLFPDIYGFYETNIHKNTKVLSSIIGNYDLPLITTSTITKQTEELTEIRVKGDIDEKKYEENKVRKMLKSLFDKYNLRTSIKVNQQEVHELDKNQRLKFSGKILFVDISNNVVMENITHIKPIDL